MDRIAVKQGAPVSNSGPSGRSSAGPGRAQPTVQLSTEAVLVRGSNPMPGFGLLGMRERVGLLQGTIRVASSPGDGTTVTASFPA